MILQEILQLDKVQSSIKKIDLYLVSTVKQSDEYIIALSYKAIILHTIGKSNEALKILFTLVPTFKELTTNSIIYICDAIIDICIDVKRYDQVEKYIQIKNTYLPVSKHVLHIKDNIKYYLATGKTTQAKEELLKYLDDDLTKEEMIFAKEELAKIYFSEHQNSKYLELVKDLEPYYQANLCLEKLAIIGLNKLKIYFESGNYTKVVLEGNQYLKDDELKNHFKICAASFLIKSYLLLNDYKKAGIIESIYCEYIDDVEPKDAIDFCYAALDLYTKTNTIVSVREYQNKINELEGIKKEKRQAQKKSKIKEEIIIPTINEEIENEIINEKNLVLNQEKEKIDVKNKIEVVYESIKNVVVSKNFESLSFVFDTISSLDLKLKFRELFRNCCIALCQKFPINEVYLLYFNRKYLGLHYKKERVYDKILEFSDIENTLSFQAMNYQEDAFISPEDSLYKYDIVTKKEYEEIPYAVAMPLNDSISAIGSIAYFSNEEFLDKEMVYESLKLITSMLNLRFLISLKQDEFEYNNKKLFFLNEKMKSGLKEEIDGYIHFSPRACEILGVLEDMTINEFYNHINSKDLIEYKRIQEQLYTLLSDDCKIEYEFKKNDDIIKVKEQFFPMVNDGVITIISIIDDITNMENDKQSLIDLAYKNPISKLNTEVKLLVDIKSVMDDKKLSLAVIDVFDFSIYRELYGYNFTNQLIYTIGKEISKVLENDFYTNVYHLEVDRFVILFTNVNDKRVIDSKLNQIFKHVSQELYNINHRVKLLFNAGVYRYARHSSICDASQMLNLALDALSDAKELKTLDNHICHFDSDLHKKRFNENSLITHISESIDYGKLGLTYKQIVNIKDNEVFAYYLILNLDNYDIDRKYMNQVCKRRGLTIELEKYSVLNAYKELKMFKESIKGYLTTFIELSNDTIEDSFYSFLNTQRNFFKIPNEYISFIVDDANNNIIARIRLLGHKIASKNIIDVYNKRCDYYMCDIHSNSFEVIKELDNICKEHDSILIVTNVDTKEDMENARREGFEIIYGEYYKKFIRMKALLEKMS